MLSMTSDFAGGQGCPEPQLRRIAEAGFTHVHWCHQWNTDFLYGEAEMEQVGRWLEDFKLTLTDLHGTNGREKRWTSSREYERLAGVELVGNRIDMTARLGGDVVIMHIEPHSDDDQYGEAYWMQLFKSLDELRPFAAERGVRLAIELGDIEPIEKVLANYEPEFIGICYDSGHGNRRPDGPGWLEQHANRLISIHLHDNDGSGDQHRIPFTGTVEWQRVIDAIAGSTYDKWISLETGIRNEPYEDQAEFLAKAHEAGTRLSEMLEASRHILK
ncbi:sugar phosphate isomerase/epimerase family protein [Planctomycetota bacterium]